MYHKGRTWQEPFVAGTDWLAKELSEEGSTYTPCSAFRVQGTDLVLLNDATGPDGAQEYAVILSADLDAGLTHGWQIESVTCSWMTPDRLKVALDELAGIAGVSDALPRFRDRCFANQVAWAQHPKTETCRWCA